MYQLLKKILFLIDAELTHNIFVYIGRIVSYTPIKTIMEYFLFIDDKRLHTQLFSKTLINPVGLSAGFDYEGYLTSILKAVGFGFSSVGTTTYLPYKGNQKPRLARLPKSKSILVNKGLKNSGIKNVIKKIKYQKKYLTGISVGPSNNQSITKTEDQITDIINAINVAERTKATYIEINISCPNSFGGESFATAEKLKTLLERIRKEKITKPIAIKFLSEASWDKAREMIQVMIDYKVEAIIMSNLIKTRTNKELNKSELQNLSKGNFSGKPVKEASNILIKKTYQEFSGKIKIIGVGGIFSSDDAYEKICLGANAVQLITGLIYEGPLLIRKINKGILKNLERDGFRNLEDAIGSKSKYKL